MKRIAVFLLAILFAMPMAMAETITLGDGTWVVGEDIPAGYYKIKSLSWGTMVMCDVINDSLEADLDASTIVRWLDTKKEFLLKEGLYICVDNGQFTFTPVELTPKQQENKTYTALTAARQNAAFNNYENKEYYECSVSAGTYTVGVDIPEGYWCIRYFNTFTKTITVTQNGVKTRFRIFSPSNSAYTPDKLTHSFLDLKAGDTITIEVEKGDNGLFFIPCLKN